MGIYDKMVSCLDWFAALTFMLPYKLSRAVFLAPYSNRVENEWPSLDSTIMAVARVPSILILVVLILLEAFGGDYYVRDWHRLLTAYGLLLIGVLALGCTLSVFHKYLYFRGRAKGLKLGADSALRFSFLDYVIYGYSEHIVRVLSNKELTEFYKTFDSLGTEVVRLWIAERIPFDLRKASHVKIEMPMLWLRKEEFKSRWLSRVVNICVVGAFLFSILTYLNTLS